MITVLHRRFVSKICQTKTTSAFLFVIFISGVRATSGDVNVIAIEKLNPDNIGIAVGILFLCVLEKSHNPLT